jgi:hypothetical protein
MGPIIHCSSIDSTWDEGPVATPQFESIDHSGMECTLNTQGYAYSCVWRPDTTTAITVTRKRAPAGARAAQRTDPRTLPEVLKIVVLL